ncbi:hypothetical protein KO493_02800 [Tamlana agarivorans]|uniref:Uncharacterized protein n=1 Tax=Pseudotamlana agarivorans TaxID=481183 RepID=A0ACC5U5L7_9FLAO|nr:hypothetical protein [Tamlana agarivorans]MBU2949623.1 hypothetical protein [Tamlana agarivorans]
MKKILYLDNWDNGYRHFLRLDKSFKNKGFETLLVHTGSWVGETSEIWVDKQIEVEKSIEGMVIRDIGYYRTNRIRKVIETEKPYAIVLINLSFIIDRAIVKICKDLNIKIFYLAHGKLITAEGQAVVKQNMRDYGKSKLQSKFTRKNMYALYNYFVEMKSFSKFFGFFYKAMQDYTQFTAFPKYSEELEATKSFVYYPMDYDVMVNEFGFPKDSVQIVGNPELDAFYNAKIKDKDIYIQDELKIENPNYVAYMDDGLSSMRNWDSSKWMVFLDDLNQILVDKKLQLVIKLHPRRKIDDCLSFFEEKGIKYFYDLDFKNYVYHSVFTLSHFSSVIIYPLLLGKSVKSPRWGLSNGIEENFPPNIINYYYNREDFEKNIFNFEINKNDIEEYLSESLANYDGKSISRIVNEVIKDA